ncbi:MAG: TadE family protein [Clostridium sp.]|uniref:TadE/TadG family type IV pilus assembly protein n=1 Tax=Clostridium sp. TaxID=1506 RepID=UPI002A826A0B|nr:TadE family protein [Clostridium sp.]MDY4253014.1 TadE family protein [Clostridium sp.]MDY6229106.1 TadE family protein [Clostridium sp.]
MRKDKGVLTIEAALMIPMFVFAILFIIQFMKVVYIYDSVQSNIYNTAKFINGYTYIYEELKKIEQTQETEKLRKIEDLLVQIANPLDDEKIKEFIEELLEEAKSEVRNAAGTAAGTAVNAIFSEIVDKNLKDEFGDGADIYLGSVSDFESDKSKLTFGENGEVLVRVKYKITFEVPFFNIKKDVEFANQVKIKSF